jgi:hypothetical protein
LRATSKASSVTADRRSSVSGPTRRRSESSSRPRYLYRERIYALRRGIEGVHLWTGYFTISFKGVRLG